MFHLFASTRAVGTGQLRAVVFSVAAHTGLIAIAITPSAPAVAHEHPVTDRGFVTEHIHFITNTPRLRVRRAAKAGAGSASTREATPRLTFPIKIDPLAPVEIPDVQLADVDFTGSVTDSLDFRGPNLAEVIGDLLGRHHVGSDNGVYTSDVVERVVMPMADNPKPEYPRQLLSAGIETRFLVRFVVDTTGHVDEHTVDFPATAHRLFVDSVRRALERSRYMPAELNGRRVSQLVSQEFVFQMVGR